MVSRLALLAVALLLLYSPPLTALDFNINWLVCDDNRTSSSDWRGAAGTAWQLALKILRRGEISMGNNSRLLVVESNCENPVELLRSVEQNFASQCNDVSNSIVVGTNMDKNAFAAIAFWSSVYSIPISAGFGGAVTLPEFGNRQQQFPFLLRTSVSVSNLVVSLANLLRSPQFSWQHVGLVGSQQYEHCSSILDAAIQTFPRKGIEIVSLISFETETPSDAEFDAALDQLAARARIIVFCLSDSAVLASDAEVRFLSRAKRKHMLSEYFAYFRPKLEFLPPVGKTGRANVSVATNLKATDLTQVFDVVPMSYNSSFSGGLKTGMMRKQIAHLVDSILIYSYAQKKALNTGRDFNSAVAIQNITKTLDFFGATGRVWFDENGSRLQTIQLLPTAMLGLLNDATASEKKVVLMQTEYTAPNYNAQRWVDQPSQSNGTSTAIRWSTVDGLPPNDLPQNYSSTENLSHALSAGALAGIICAAAVVLSVLVGLAILALIYRSRSRTLAAATAAWRIKFQDLHFISMSTTAMLRATTSTSLSTLSGSAAASGLQDVLRGRDDREDRRSLASLVSNSAADHVASSMIRAGDEHVWTARYGLDKVRVNLLTLAAIHVSREFEQELCLLRGLISTDLSRFIGLCVEDENCCIVWEFAAKGCVRNIMCRSQISVDRAFQLSILSDIARGLLYLHHSALYAHGLLNSYTCVVDDRFAVKLADFGTGRLRRMIREINNTEADLLSPAAPSIRLNDEASSIASGPAAGQEYRPHKSNLRSSPSPSQDNSQTSNSLQQQSHNVSFSLSTATDPSASSAANAPSSLGGGRGMACVYCGGHNLRLLLWCAPELLRFAECDQPLNGTPQADVYAYGIIISEILTKREPYETEIASGIFSSADDAVRAVRNRLEPPMRPSFNQRNNNNNDGAASEREPLLLMDLARACWHEEPSVRPTPKIILEKLKQMTPDGRMPNITLDLLNRLKSYADDLEAIVAERSAELNREKLKFEQMLFQMIPRSVGEELLREGRVEPRAYTSATICFSEMADFALVTARFSPLQIVDALNILHTAFEAAIKPFDVFQVETICDSNTMLVSGVPIPNGNAHAIECGLAALAVQQMTLSDQLISLLAASNHKFHMQVGIHTGACVAGIIGVKMPKYCLFGDTVNTASRMQSRGVAGKIQVSREFVETARYYTNNKRDAPELTFSVRGNVEVKGKGTMETFWLAAAQPRPNSF